MFRLRIEGVEIEAPTKVIHTGLDDSQIVNVFEKSE